MALMVADSVVESANHTDAGDADGVPTVTGMAETVADPTTVMVLPPTSLMATVTG
jgi:hypothetical protein